MSQIAQVTVEGGGVMLNSGVSVDANHTTTNKHPHKAQLAHSQAALDALS